MKRIIPFFTLFLAAASLFAQSPITIEPNPVDFVFDGDLTLQENFDIEQKYTVTNVSDETVNLIWFREVAPGCNADWAFPVCDNNLCYFEGVFSNSQPGTLGPAILESGESSEIFSLHVKANGQDGCCWVKLHYFLEEDLTDTIATAYFDIRFNDPQCSLTSVEEEIASAIKIFPNPVTDYFQLQGNEENVVKQLAVYNLIGRQVRTFDAVNQRQFDMSGLPQGIYLVGMMGENGEVLRTVRMSRQFVTP